MTESVRRARAVISFRFEDGHVEPHRVDVPFLDDWVLPRAGGSIRFRLTTLEDGSIEYRQAPCPYSDLKSRV